MKTPAFLLSLLGFALFTAACSSIDVARETPPDRVLSGSVLARAAVPAGAQVTVRLIDIAARETNRNPLNDMATGARPPPGPTERLVAERTFVVGATTAEPIPFRLEYSATEAELRNGLNLEARVSHDGKVRHRTINAHVVTLASSPFQHELPVEPVQ